MSKKVVLSGYFGFKNFGDEAILSVLISKLQEFNTDITVITSDINYTESLHNVKCVKTFDILSIICAIFKSDILISGGGSLLQDATSLKSLVYYLYIIMIALFFKKKVIIFAQGIGPINNIFGQILTKSLLKRCNYISVRDSESAKLLLNWGISSEVVCDPVFSVPVVRVPKSEIIGIQLRNCKGMSNKFLNKLADYVLANFGDYKIEIYSLQDSIDLDVCTKFYNMINDKINAQLFSDMSFNDVLDCINRCEYLIGMRFHSLIIGLISGVKPVAVNYDIKVKKIAGEFNLPVIALDKNIEIILNDIDTARIDDKLTNYNFAWDGFISAMND